MSNHYAIGLLVEQHHAELRNEAAQDRLARLARLGTAASAPLVGAADAVPLAGPRPGDRDPAPASRSPLPATASTDPPPPSPPATPPAERRR